VCFSWVNEAVNSLPAAVVARITFPSVCTTLRLPFLPSGVRVGVRVRVRVRVMLGVSVRVQVRVGVGGLALSSGLEGLGLGFGSGLGSGLNDPLPPARCLVVKKGVPISAT
jgi:hypothetical protein